MKQQKEIIIRIAMGILLVSAGFFCSIFVAKTITQRIYFLVYIALILWIEIYWVKKLKNKIKDKQN